MSEVHSALELRYAALRDEPDTDPLVEEMVARLRHGIGSLHALDEWGRPMSWRNVVRLAAAPLVSRLRDAETAVALSRSLDALETDATHLPADSLTATG